MSFFKERNCYLKNYNLSLTDKMKKFNYRYAALICLVVFIGIGILYSAGNGHFSPWADRQFMRFLLSFVLFYVVSLINLRFWMKYAYWIYAGGILLLLGVSLFGHVGMGAQRWLNLGIINVQPSEVMKIALVIALARYFHGSSPADIRSWQHLAPPLLLMLWPVLFIIAQPDLGTALMLVFVTGALLFVVGVQLWKFLLVFVLGGISMPILWFFMHDYQKQRVLTFLYPESDPLGTGYHIIQSKITLGSGGLFGKGFMESTQSRLSFLPEKQTDFIFTLFSEEFGFLGSCTLIALFFGIIIYGFLIAARCHNFFGKLLAIGLTVNFALYVFINIGMVSGLLPVVGVPLPLISYGGTAMLTLFIGFGLIEAVDINREMVIGRLGSIEDE